ncbi:hypothetical protein BDV93DRAFT_494206 [Ceratobasidium sp. AG-I]|nr:hypothetical protein BDV93DRAFT_494206 [Ceratobasidium sp. AG-I]
MSAQINALESLGKIDGTARVTIRFKSVGNAPIMVKNEYNISASQPLQAVIIFPRRQLGWRSADALFVCINLLFALALDETIMNLYKAGRLS